MHRRPLYSRSGGPARGGDAGFPPIALRPASGVAPPPRAPGFAERSRRHWRRAYRRHQGKLLVLAALCMSGVVLGAYDAIKGPSLGLTPAQFVETVNGLVDARPLPPARSATAYAEVIRSVVAVMGYDPDAYKSLPPASPDDRPGIHYDTRGTGVVVEDDGTILTNLHVVRGAPMIRVSFFDGSVADATIVGTQPANDLAVLRPVRVPAGLEPATMTSATTLSPGDEVVAIGYPFGVGPSASAGIVSGLGRVFDDRGRPSLANLIQFDASTNPGNSGGPLVNASGEVVGIVTALMNPTGARTFAGIGFAVTIDTAAAAIGDSPL